MDASQIKLVLDFQEADGDRQKQETLTQQLFQQLRQMRGVSVERISDPNPPKGSRGISFLWGLLQADVSLDSIKNLGKFLGDRLGDKPVKVEAKFPDGREYKAEASSREELAAAVEAIEKLAQVK